MKAPIMPAILTLLASCATPPVTGTFATRDGTIRIHPDGRVQLVIEPRATK
jgi:hypothetical protein